MAFDRRKLTDDETKINNGFKSVGKSADESAGKALGRLHCSDAEGVLGFQAMKKKFRRGGGSEPKPTPKPMPKTTPKSASKNSQNSGHSSQNSPKIQNSSAPDAAQKMAQRPQRKSRKDIRNARSLGEVLGGVSGRSRGPQSGPQRRETAGPVRDRPTDSSSRPSPPDAAGLSKKLTYIMNFQPPPSSADGTRPATQPVSKPITPRPSTAPAAATPARSGPIPNRQTTAKPLSSPAADTSAKSGEFRWPKERVKTVSPGMQPSEVGTRSAPAKGGRNLITGIVKRHPDGFGFLIPDDSEHVDVYISRQSMIGVMTNDRVEVSVYKPRTKSKDDRMAGEITRVLARAHQRIVGKFLPVDKKYGVIQDENRGWGADLRIPTADSMNAKEGDLIAVEVTQFPDDAHEFTGRVVSLMGTADDPMNDVLRVVHASGIPTEFSAIALSEARQYGGTVTDAEIRGREDLTQVGLITIDGATARDFDDAIFTEQTANGFRLIVGIADVSHYVKPGTRLDQEAYERGTSTYFPNFVVPMLPEELSNELCSLKPNVKRLTFACEIHLSFEGEVQSYRFFEAVMVSKARVTYGEAQEVLDGKAPPRLRDVAENIRKSADLAKVLMQKRFREGSLDLEIPETQVVVDASGETVDIIRSERLFAHRLIEELMLVTNICTARFLDGAKIPGIFRIHEEPDPDNIKALQRYLWNFGANRSLLTGSGGLQKKLTKALQSLDGKPEHQILSILTLRTMKQAQYSPRNVGHFGLGFEHYSHFTSPIRRYPDLIAHRLIKSQIYPRYKMMQMTEDELASAATFLSACEQRSTKAERQVISIKKARFIRKFIGQEFDGIISSVTKFGCFVALRQYDVDGLIKIENLGDDRFEFDDQNLRLIGPRIGVRYTIGDLIRVLVVASDPEQGRIDFALADEPKRQRLGDADDDGEERGRKNGPRQRNASTAQPSNKKNEKFSAPKRGKAENDRRGVRKERVSKRRRKD